MSYFLDIKDYLSMLEDCAFVASEVTETALAKHECLVAFHTGAKVAVALGCKDMHVVEKMAGILCVAFGCLNYKCLEDADTGVCRIIDNRRCVEPNNSVCALHMFLKLKVKKEYDAPELFQIKCVFEAALGAVLEETVVCRPLRDVCRGGDGIAHHMRELRALLNAVYQSDSGEPEFDMTKLPSGRSFDKISLGLWKEFSQAYLDYVSHKED